MLAHSIATVVEKTARTEAQVRETFMGCNPQDRRE
jgi:hypothetical protein